MTEVHHAAVINFRVPPSPGSVIKMAHTLPDGYSAYSIKGARVEFAQGDFGCYFSQELSHYTWRITWLNFFIQKRVRILPVTDDAMVAICCTLKGDIPCTLEGYGDLVLQRNRYGFYYIPPKFENTAMFEQGYYEVVYISLSSAALVEFIDQHPHFGELYLKQQEAAASGQVLPQFIIGPDELDTLLAIRHCGHAGPAQRIFLQARIQDLLISYFTAQDLHACMPAADSETEMRLKEAAAYIRQNYHLPISVTALSKQAHMNINSFEKAFKKVYKLGPRNYIEQVRVEEAKRLLHHTITPVNKIAYEVGFAGPSYFSTVFKKFTHRSPRQYRLEMNKEVQVKK